MGLGTVTKAAQCWLTSTRSGPETAACMRRERRELWILDKESGLMYVTRQQRTPVWIVPSTLRTTRLTQV